ncbi:IS630 family transposase [Isosphaeraceae bacterium EP7]
MEVSPRRPRHGRPRPSPPDDVRGAAGHRRVAPLAHRPGPPGRASPHRPGGRLRPIGPHHRCGPRLLAADRLCLDPSLQRAGHGRPPGAAPRRPTADLYRRPAGRGPGRRADRPPGPGPALRLLDARPPGGLPQRAEGHRHQAESDRRDPRGGGPPLAQAGDVVRRAGGPRIRRKKGAIERLYREPPADSAVVCLDEMGPESAKSFPGQNPLRTKPETTAEGSRQPAGRARQEADYGRRGKGYVFGAFRPATGEAFTRPYDSRSTRNWVEFLGQVEAWVPADAERVYAILDNLSAHRATDVLLFSLAHPRWEFVFQPVSAAYLNLIEPWWKVLRSLALKGRRFETWEEICQAVERATAYWNAHRHPFVWGRRRRHQPRRTPGIAAVPGVRTLAG